jgi:hypothetical protein
MGVIDQAQNVVVEVGGMIVFLAGVAGIAAPVVGFDPQLGVAGPVVALVIGLYIMGYKKIPNRIRDVVGS